MNSQDNIIPQTTAVFQPENAVFQEKFLPEALRRKDLRPPMSAYCLSGSGI